MIPTALDIPASELPELAELADIDPKPTPTSPYPLNKNLKTAPNTKTPSFIQTGAWAPGELAKAVELNKKLKKALGEAVAADSDEKLKGKLNEALKLDAELDQVFDRAEKERKRRELEVADYEKGIDEESKRLSAASAKRGRHF